MIIEPKIGYKVVFNSKGKYLSFIAVLFSTHNPDIKYKTEKEKFLRDNPGFILEFQLNKWTRTELRTPILLFDNLDAARFFITDEDETDGGTCSILKCEYIPSEKEIKLFYPTAMEDGVSPEKLLEYNERSVPYYSVGADLVRPLENVSRKY